MDSVDYEWDRQKEKTNYRKHKVRFTDAVMVLQDERAVTITDFSIVDEERWITVGMDGFGRVLVVVYVWRRERIRLISARCATPSERHMYEEGLVN